MQKYRIQLTPTAAATASREEGNTFVLFLSFYKNMTISTGNRIGGDTYFIFRRNLSQINFVYWILMPPNGNIVKIIYLRRVDVGGLIINLFIPQPQLQVYTFGK